MEVCQGRLSLHKGPAASPHPRPPPPPRRPPPPPHKRPVKQQGTLTTARTPPQGDGTAWDIMWQ